MNPDFDLPAFLLGKLSPCQLFSAIIYNGLHTVRHGAGMGGDVLKHLNVKGHSDSPFHAFMMFLLVNRNE